MKNLPIKALIMCGTLVIVSFCLSFFRVELPLHSIIHPFYLFPIIIIGYMYGTKYGIIAGTILGTLVYVQNPDSSTPAAIIFGCILPFSVLGLSGLLKSRKNGLITGFILSIALCFFVSVISDIVFVPSNADFFGYTPICYSLLHNTYSILIDGVISIAALFIPLVRNAVEKTKKVTLES